MPILNMNDLLVVERARLFAERAHEGQVRKVSGAPHTAHTVRVALLVAMSGAEISSIVASHLHDTVEDTPTTLDQIEELFGEKVRHFVDLLTHRDGETRRQHLDRLIESGDLLALQIRVADRIDNLTDGMHRGRDWMRSYLISTRQLVDAVKQTSLINEPLGKLLNSKYIEACRLVQSD